MCSEFGALKVVITLDFKKITSDSSDPQYVRWEHFICILKKKNLMKFPFNPFNFV